MLLERVAADSCQLDGIAYRDAAMFARKFDAAGDDLVLDMIDRQLLHDQPAPSASSPAYAAACNRG